MKNNYIYLCFIFIFITIGCIGNNPNTTPVSPTPSSSPTPDNVLRVFTDTIIDRNCTVWERSENVEISFNLKKDDVVEISITELTGGNRDIDFRIWESGSPNMYMKNHVSRGEGSYSWTVPHDGTYWIIFDNEQYDFYKELHYKITATYISTERRYS